MREREKWKTDKEPLVSGGVLDLYTDYWVRHDRQEVWKEVEN